MEELKDILFFVTVIVSIVSSFLAVKYKAEQNGIKNSEIEDGLKSFKEFAYKELKDIDTQITKLNIGLQEMLTKKEAEERYITKKELELTIKNIDSNFTTIKDLLDDIKRRVNG